MPIFERIQNVFDETSQSTAEVAISRHFSCYEMEV